jgi:hypothetical protein
LHHADVNQASSESEGVTASERDLARIDRERAAQERELATAAEGDERARHDEAARSFEESAAFHDRLAEILDQYDP